MSLSEVAQNLKRLDALHSISESITPRELLLFPGSDISFLLDLIIDRPLSKCELLDFLLPILDEKGIVEDEEDEVKMVFVLVRALNRRMMREYSIRKAYSIFFEELDLSDKSQSKKIFEEILSNFVFESEEVKKKVYTFFNVGEESSSLKEEEEEKEEKEEKEEEEISFVQFASLLNKEETLYTKEEALLLFPYLPEQYFTPKSDVSFLKYYSSDKLLDRVCGPQNPKVNKECTSLTVTGKRRGRCRMLTCECHISGPIHKKSETEEIDDVLIDELTPFEGKCDWCLNEIKNISHSFRYPKKKGGWRGWYCSEECLLSHNLTPRNKERLLVFVNHLSSINIIDREKNIDI